MLISKIIFFFLKIILIYFQTKNILKINFYHTSQQCLKVVLGVPIVKYHIHRDARVQCTKERAPPIGE